MRMGACVHNLRRLWYRLLGWRWQEAELESGLIFAVILDRKYLLRAIHFRHHPTKYKKISIADSRGSMLIHIDSYLWRGVVDFLGSKNPNDLPSDFFFEKDWDVTFYSMDGEIFSLLIVDISKILAQHCCLRNKDAKKNSAL